MPHKETELIINTLDNLLRTAHYAFHTCLHLANCHVHLSGHLCSPRHASVDIYSYLQKTVSFEELSTCVLSSPVIPVVLLIVDTAQVSVPCVAHGTQQQ